MTKEINITDKNNKLVACLVIDWKTKQIKTIINNDYDLKEDGTLIEIN